MPVVLFELMFTHHAPKNQEKGVKEYIIADDTEQIVQYLNENYRIFDDVATIRTFWPTEKWWSENEHKRQTLEGYGLKLEGLGNVVGDSNQLTLWCEGTYWRAAPGPESDAYYGFVHYDWSNQQDIDPDQADTLRELGIAIDLSSRCKKRYPNYVPSRRR